MQRLTALLTGLFLTASGAVHAQDVRAISTKTDSVLTLSDSLSIFRLVDSLMILFDEQNHSVLNFRLLYNSNVMAAGRTLGIAQFGLSPGITWYHKSGLYADLTGYWSRDFTPTYYLTVLSAGYMHPFGERFMAMASYDRYEYQFDESFTPFKNALTVSASADLKFLTLQTDYSFFFGDEKVHRITQSVSGRLEKEHIWKLDKVSFAPGVFVLLGDATISEIILPQTRAEWILAWFRLRNGNPWYTVRTYRVFGVMNYAFLAPLMLQKKRFTLTLSYMYNIPRALPGEMLLLSESGFIMAGLSYRLPLKRKSDW
jgi:hypothetical protein